MSTLVLYHYYLKSIMGFLYIMENMAVLYQFADLDILSKSVLDNLNFDLWCGKNAEWEDVRRPHSAELNECAEHDAQKTDFEESYLFHKW
jgi:hypothetical protein